MDFRAPQIKKKKKMIVFGYLLVGDDGVKEEEESRVIHLGARSDRGQLWEGWYIVAGDKFGVTVGSQWGHSGAQQAGGSLDLRPWGKIWHEDKLISHQYGNVTPGRVWE